MNRVYASKTSSVKSPTVVRRHVLSALIALALFGGVGSVHAANAPNDGAAGADTGAPAIDAADASFDRSMLSGAGQNTTDLSRFERGDFVLPGNYSVDIYLNDVFVGRNDIRLASTSADVSARVCVNRALLDKLGLHPADLSEQLSAELTDEAACVDISRVIPGASFGFDVGDLRLNVSVPQAFMGLQARGYVDPRYWDSGVNAGLLNYNFNSYHTSSGGASQTSSYLGLNAGLNLGRWHLRHNSSLNWQSAVGNIGAAHRWQNISTYAQRDLPGLHAQLTVGDSFTSGEIFDSLGLRGVQLATDDRMLPQSLRGYAPTVRGVADSNAKVTVRQNGMVIYETTVAPGPFSISDLYATGYGGDLTVTVLEAGGRVHTFSVPYASVPQLLRPGVSRFSVAAGQLRDQSLQHSPAVLQGTLQHGFTNMLTGFAGIEGSQGYAAALLGSALNTNYGAFAMDVTAARTQIPGLDTMSGQSVRLSYSKIMAQTGTSLTVAAYRYSTDGYLSLNDAVRARDYSRRGLPVFATGSQRPLLINGVPVSGLLTPAQQAALAGVDPRDLLVPAGVDRQRNNFSLTLTQQLGTRGGSLYVNGSARDYWNRGGRDTQFQVGYNNSIGRLSYNLSASRERDLFGRTDNRYMANVTIPLGNNSTHTPLLTGALSRGSNGDMQEQATLSGSAGADDRFSYGATAAHERGDDTGSAGSTGSITGGYRGTHVLLNAGFGAGSGYSQSSLNVAGGIVAHSGGVLFGQTLGDTVAIVEAPDAAGATIGNAAGVRVGRSGYALIPYLTPYQLDTVTIDPSGLPLDVQLDTTSTQLAPRGGAVVLVKFKTESGRFLLFQAKLADGSALPFGAEVKDEQGHPVGVVGQAGQIMVRVSGESGRLNVQWESTAGAAHQCTFAYGMPDSTTTGPATRYVTQDVICRDPGTQTASEGHRHEQ